MWLEMKKHCSQLYTHYTWMVVTTV